MLSALSCVAFQAMPGFRQKQSGKARFFFLAATLALVAGFAQTGTWTRERLTVSPPARGTGMMAYDSARSQTVLFGGINANSLGPHNLNDTWIQTGNSWIQLFPANSPSPRYGSLMVYNPLQQNSVLFGGANLTNVIHTYGDTWTWDGINWTQLFPTTSPGPRYCTGMAYDLTFHQAVMFGGFGNNQYLAETWVWDGINWTQKFPAVHPSPRLYPVMAYDVLHGQTVLFGGSDANGYLGDTWVWDGSNWTQKFPASSPSARYGATMSYNGVRGRTLLFAGINASGNLGDTWIWDGVNWTQTSPFQSPTSRFDAMTTYDSTHQNILLFGGGKNIYGDIFLADTWVWQ